MSFNIKCFFGRHDWETVYTIRERVILKSMKGQNVETQLNVIDFKFKNMSLGLPLFHHKDGRLYEQKICLRCCAIKDEVAEYIREFFGNKINKEFEEFYAKRRQQQAKSMAKACAADKFMKITGKESA